MRAFLFLLRKEFLQIFRDRMLIGVIFLMPVVQLLLLANAATYEVKHAQVFVVDQDHSAKSRGVMDRLLASGRFVSAGASASVADAEEAMQRRKTDIILVIPADFERDLVRDHRAPVQLIFNAEDGAAAGVAQSYAASILARYSAEIGVEVAPVLAQERAGTGLPPVRGRPVISVRARGWYNVDLNYLAYMVPAVLVVLVTVVGTPLTAVNIVREKESGTLDQLNVTPITRITFIAAKLVPLWVLALFTLTASIGISWIVFDLPIRGSLLLVLVAAGIYLMAALGVGLFISTIAQTQQQAMFVSYAVLLIYLLMSGLFTPLRSMPEWAQWVAQASPVMHFTELMRAVLLKGAGWTDVRYQLAMLTGIGVVVLALAVRQYRKRSS